ncbi:MAG TPA: CPBP family intramembrane glutamic endopeptidase [Methylomirabilota bacterium]|nr:CPBP family intramembrane glutamic endopeptidase [Methylomirabilota bacterium]
MSTAVVAFWSFAALRVVIEPLRARFNLAWLLAAMLLATPTYVAAHFTVEWLVALGIQDVNYLLIFQEEGYGLGWAVLLVCVQPAIVEEVAFRGVVQGSLNGVLGSRQALWVSALMFAILHLSIPSLPHLLALGLVLGWFRNRTNSLVPGMFLHFTHNLLVILHEAGEIPWV